MGSTEVDGMKMDGMGKEEDLYSQSMLDLRACSLNRG